jgi:hypothetical protein
MLEQEWPDQKPRTLTEILDAIDLLMHQVWYNRHQVRREKIEAGEIEIVEKETYPGAPDTASRASWITLPFRSVILDSAALAAFACPAASGKKSTMPFFCRSSHPHPLLPHVTVAF